MRKKRDNLKSPEQELRIFRVRALLAVVLVFALTGVLMGRLAWLQVVQHEVYSTRSEKNRVRVEPLPPNRGLIFDRNGVLLAENRPTYNLTLVRERAPRPAPVAKPATPSPSRLKGGMLAAIADRNVMVLVATLAANSFAIAVLSPVLSLYIRDLVGDVPNLSTIAGAVMSGCSRPPSSPHPPDQFFSPCRT